MSNGIDPNDLLVEDVDRLELAEGENSQYADDLQDIFENEREEDTNANEALIVLRSYMAERLALIWASTPRTACDYSNRYLADEKGRTPGGKPTLKKVHTNHVVDYIEPRTVAILENIKGDLCSAFEGFTIETPCRRCGRRDHLDVRSRLCPHNRYYGIPIAQQRRQQEQQDRQQGLQQLNAQVANPNVERCGHCVIQDSQPDACLPHANASSIRCHVHPPNIDKVLQGILGDNFTRAVRKYTLKRALIVHGTRQQSLRQKAIISRQTNRVVDYVRAVAVKTQFFVQYFVLYRLSEGQHVPNIVFLQNLVYGVIQLVTGGDIANQNLKLPEDTTAVFVQYKAQFADPEQCSVPLLPDYSLVFPFESRAISFITHQIRQVPDRQNWPSKGRMKRIGIRCNTNEHDPPGEALNVPKPVQVAIDEVIMQTFLGPTPINHDHLLANVGEYTQVLFGMLQEMKSNSSSSAIQDSPEITDQVDHGWLSIQLQAMPAYLNLP
ncbi:hypothetical protein DFQ28_005221 [Apophysomyces sp. BC1034]|nr:hypothetical protein DFQ28_005221 [Apophysomyces sp. BC1034]